MPTLSGAAVELRPTVAGDAETLREIRRQPEIHRWWDELEDEFPFDDEPGVVRLTIHHAGEAVGMVQFGEVDDPKYRSASIDIFVGRDHQRRGIASEAIRLVVDHLLTERGHHRLTIDATADNRAAIACYSKLGFEPVGTMRAAERDVGADGWHDSLLMELVVDPPSRRR
ncbi:MAG: GNAT family N-acetyltransferase [Actinomycetota bacterium]|nr:GNAT family N-acetyltransferase [Actinomycetota bacterium]